MTAPAAPCGMECETCPAHTRKRNPCPGCRALPQDAPKTRLLCGIRTCGERKGEYCGGCFTFPCALLTRLDQRYRKKTGFSPLKNIRKKTSPAK